MSIANDVVGIRRIPVLLRLFTPTTAHKEEDEDSDGGEDGEAANDATDDWANVGFAATTRIASSCLARRICQATAAIQVSLVYHVLGELTLDLSLPR